MNNKVSLDLTSLRLIFERNKPYLFSVVTIIVCIILFFQFIIPQFRALLTAKEEGKEASLKLAVLKENLNILMNVDENSLDTQLKILNLALPGNKDFSGILNSIYSASQKTGVGLGAFSLQIGDLSVLEKNKFSTINISVPIDGSSLAVSGFVDAISRSLPLAEISLIRIGDRTSTVNLSFYYKPLDASTYKEDDRISPIPQEGLALINQLINFDNTSPPSSFENIPVSSPSALQ